MPQSQIIIDPILFSFLGVIMSLLLGVIAFFLAKLVNKVDELGTTLAKFDKDVSSKIEVLQERTRNTDALFNRIRTVEDDIIALRVGGCEFYKQTHNGVSGRS